MEDEEQEDNDDFDWFFCPFCGNFHDHATWLECQEENEDLSKYLPDTLEEKRGER
jgi:hypothetical protein